MCPPRADKLEPEATVEDRIPEVNELPAEDDEPEHPGDKPEAAEVELT